MYIYIYIHNSNNNKHNLKRRHSLPKSLCPVVMCPYLCSSDTFAQDRWLRRRRWLWLLRTLKRRRNRFTGPENGTYIYIYIYV